MSPSARAALAPLPIGAVLLVASLALTIASFFVGSASLSAYATISFGLVLVRFTSASVWPSAGTAHTTAGFWGALMCCELPLHVGAFVSFFYFALSSPTSAPAWFGPLWSALGVAALIPLVRATWALMGVRAALKRVAAEAGVVPNALNDGASLARALACVTFPFFSWGILARGVRTTKGAVYGSEPAVLRPVAGPTDRLTKLRVDVMLPAAGAPEPTRAFLYFHGGAWVTGSRLLAAQPLLAALAARGWLVATADYRHAPRVDVFAQARDVRSCARWLKEHYPSAAKCLVIAGESAGGHLSLLAALSGDECGGESASSNRATGPDSGAGAVAAAATSSVGQAPICEGVVALCAVTDFTDGAGSYASRMGGADHSTARFLERFVLRQRAADATGRALSGVFPFIRASPLWRVSGAGFPAAARAAGLCIDPSAPHGDLSPEEIVEQNSRARMLVAGLANCIKPRAKEASTLVSARVFYGAMPAASPADIAKAIGGDFCTDRRVPPIALIHGENDTVVPAADSIRFFRALAERRSREAASLTPRGKDALAVLPFTAHASIYALSARTLAVADFVCDWADAL